MVQTQLNATQLTPLRKTLLDDEEFLRLAKYFIKSIPFDDGDGQFKEFYTAALSSAPSNRAPLAMPQAAFPNPQTRGADHGASSCCGAIRVVG